MTGLTRRAATLAARVEVRGVGLHSGRQARVRLTPAPAADGITFVRRDLGGARIRASPLHVVSTARSTTLGESSTGGASVATVEHLMAALSGAGVSACIVDVDAPELPVLDGSAAPWLDAINTVGLAPLDDEPAVAVSLSRPLAAPDETSDGWAIAMPASEPRLTVGIDFSSHEPIGRQWFTWTPDPETFGAEVAPARTFAVEEHLAPMRAAGLLRGGSLKHGLLCSKRRWINGGARDAMRPPPPLDRPRPTAPQVRCASPTNHAGTSCSIFSATSRSSALSPSPTSSLTKRATDCMCGSRRRCSRRMGPARTWTSPAGSAQPGTATCRRRIRRMQTMMRDVNNTPRNIYEMYRK